MYHYQNVAFIVEIEMSSSSYLMNYTPEIVINKFIS